MKHDPNVANPREPWKVSFGVGTVFLGCLLAGALFTAFVALWMWIVVPKEVLESVDPPLSVIELALFLGASATVMLMVVGPLFALLLGRVLRNVENHGLHVAVFAVAGALLGAGVGGLLGPDMMLILGPTMGAATGLARAIVSRFARP